MLSESCWKVHSLVSIPVCSPGMGTHTAAMHDAVGRGPEAAQVLYSLQVWMLVDGLLVQKIGHQPLPQGSRCPLTQNFCCSCLPKKVLSVFHHPNPSCSLSGHCHDHLSSADIPLQAASLFFQFTY